MLNAVWRALQDSFFMFWEVLWPLALGFLLSAMVQTVVSKRAIAGTLGRPDFKGFLLACGFGAASSSCSYASVAVARALFRRGASCVNAIIFEFASSNLVFELGLILLILLGWQFLAAEFAGGLLMAVPPEKAPRVVERLGAADVGSVSARERRWPSVCGRRRS